MAAGRNAQQAIGMLIKRTTVLAERLQRENVALGVAFHEAVRRDLFKKEGDPLAGAWGAQHRAADAIRSLTNRLQDIYALTIAIEGRIDASAPEDMGEQ